MATKSSIVLIGVWDNDASYLKLNGKKLESPFTRYKECNNYGEDGICGWMELNLHLLKDGEYELCHYPYNYQWSNALAEPGGFPETFRFSKCGNSITTEKGTFDVLDLFDYFSGDFSRPVSRPPKGDLIGDNLSFRESRKYLFSNIVKICKGK